jgi:hypothetical protein
MVFSVTWTVGGPVVLDVFFELVQLGPDDFGAVLDTISQWSLVLLFHRRVEMDFGVRLAVEFPRIGEAELEYAFSGTKKLIGASAIKRKACSKCKFTCGV